MISADITCIEQYAHIGKNVVEGCKNTITFDSENLIISSKAANKELCAVFFELNEDLIKDLKAFLHVLEASYEV